MHEWKKILYILSLFLFLFSFSFFLPFFISLVYAEKTWPAFAESFLITLFVSGLFYVLSYKQKDRELHSRDGFILVGLMWLFTIFFSALPYLFCNTFPTFTDCFFESASGYTTTGASVLEYIESSPKGILFWRSLTQWLGGMGIIVLYIAILPMLGSGGIKLFSAEATGVKLEKVRPRIKEMAKTLWLVYIFFTILEAILLLFGGMSLFDAVCHSFSTLSIGGFSTKNSSIAYFHSTYIDIVVIIFMFIGAVNFSLHWRVFNKKTLDYWKSEEFRTFVFLLIISTVVIFADNLSFYGWNILKTLQYTVFQVITCSTTTGFTTYDFNSWHVFSKIVLLFLMVIGGMAASTAGGIKVIRFAIAKKLVNMVMHKLVHPHTVKEVTFNGEVVSKDVLYAVVGMIFLYIILFFIGSLFVSFSADIVTAMTATIACLSNMGPGLGGVGPTANYAHFSILSKWVLSFCMIVGRLEFYTILVLFSVSFWRR